MTPLTNRARKAAAAGVLVMAAALSAAGPAQAAFPGNNGRVAFATQTFNASNQLVRSNIETVNADGSGRALFPTCRRRRTCGDGDPTWSPNGSLLAFASRTRLGTAAATGTNVDRLRRRTRSDGQPAWAPDGTRLAFTGQLSATSPTNVFILGCAGCGITPLTFRGGTESTWSSTNRVAFTRKNNIYTMASTAKRAKRLTFKGGTQADWSPHASKLAFVRKGNIYTVARNGKRLKKITGASGSQPVWSPDAKQLAFVRRGAIWVVGTDKKGLRQVAAPVPVVPLSPGQSVRVAAPSWQPVG